MAVCQECGLEMLEAATCSVENLVFPDGRRLPRIPYGAEEPRWRAGRCHDCGVATGGYHHLGCDVERCPDCLDQLISCCCLDDEDRDQSDADDCSLWVDVPAAIEIVSRILLGHPGWDHMNIDPIVTCGHVGKGYVRDMVRGNELPLEEWFQLGRWLGEETAAILFTCRSREPDKIGEVDLDIGRAMDVFVRSNGMPPWDLVYVTESGNFRASDLLGLPGLPRFEPCTFDPQEELSERHRLDAPPGS